MCGRFGFIGTNESIVKKRFGIAKIEGKLLPRYNIAPSQNVHAILNIHSDTLALVRWGLVPHWASDPAIGNRMINARAETLLEKPSFRQSIRKKRCLIISDCFYEWKTEAKAKLPFCIRLKDNSLFAFAGIWDIWEKADKPSLTCSIITTDANAIVGKIHDRMPVILRRDDEKRWLQDIEAEEAVKMLKPYDSHAMEAYEISKLINTPTNDIPEVIRPV